MITPGIATRTTTRGRGGASSASMVKPQIIRAISPAIRATVSTVTTAGAIYRQTLGVLHLFVEEGGALPLQTVHLFQQRGGVQVVQPLVPGR